MSLSHRLIIEAASQVDEKWSRIERFISTTGKDGRGVLERMLEELSPLRSARYDPPSARPTPPADPDDPEGLTSAPSYGDPTGEAVAHRHGKPQAEKDLESVLHKLQHSSRVGDEVLAIFDRYPDRGHVPTGDELIALREITAENTTDNCQSCHRVQSRNKTRFNVMATNIGQYKGSMWRLCDFCAAHLLFIEPCPRCEKVDELPTHQEIKDHHEPPKRMKDAG